MLKYTLASMAASAAAQTTLNINVGTQKGSFKTGDDIGELNAHDYRPGEFVTNDFIYEGLMEWDGAHPNGADGVAGTDDDYVKGNLAESWTTNLAALQAATPGCTVGTAGCPRYEITFTLRSGVTFHDGEAWDAAACKINFDHIMGGDGVATASTAASKGLAGLHDWMGLALELYSWETVGTMQFKMTFTTYYEAAFRELAFIRPVRMMSPLVLPNIANGELSHNRKRCGGPQPRTDASCFDRTFPSLSCTLGTAGCFIGRGVSAPVGTGPYKVISKTLSTGTVVPAADFNASCYYADPTSPPPYLEECRYAGSATVTSVLFQKFAGHRKNPTYDDIVLKSYANVNGVKAALQAGTLDVAYGVQTLSPSAFIALATAEEGSNVVAHKAAHDMNTRLVVLNSAGALNTTDLRKYVMGILAAGRQALYDGELAEEAPMDTLFDPTAPHCSSLASAPTIATLTTMSTAAKAANLAQLQTALAARALRTGNPNDAKLRFMYKPAIPHEAIIAAYVISQLAVAGIDVHPIPVDKDGYNSLNCNYMAPVYSYNDNGADGVANTADDVECDTAFAAKGFASASECYSSYHGWDIAYSETWGAPYDPTSKLWDMTHGHFSGWCSAESDAPAVTNMEFMSVTAFGSAVRALSTTVDKTARDTAYSNILLGLHNEAIFLPLTGKRQTAVTNTGVSGFQFGYMEFDMPLANLFPTPPTPPPAAPSTELPGGALIGIIVAAAAAAGFALLTTCLIMKEKAGKPIFTSLKDTPSKAAQGSAAA